ncbi:hypothetical protein AU510_10585 [Lonsdalea britannica]|nr:hypothetical protein AU510_10585 [Lonsdalea britannica]
MIIRLDGVKVNDCRTGASCWEEAKRCSAVIERDKTRDAAGKKGYRHYLSGFKKRTDAARISQRRYFILSEKWLSLHKTNQKAVL